MKICLFGCKATTLLLADHLDEIFGVDTIVTIDPQKGARSQVADYCDVGDWARSHGCRTYHASRYDLAAESDAEFFEKERFDLGFVAGWQRLVPSRVLSAFRLGVFGMHGSATNLPRGRGRSPMNWALIEGRKVFYTNLFRYDPGVDSGDVLDTFCFTIGEQDTAETLHLKNTLAMIALIERNRGQFREGKLALAPQSDEGATFYPKRAPDDSLIDWEAPIERIERFIRAVAPPFNGAFSMLGSSRVTIRRAALFELDAVPIVGTGRNGQIVEVFPNGKFLVRCSGGLLIVHEFDADRPEEIARGAVLHDGPFARREFAQNRHGGFDVAIPEATP